jgi:Terminase small subunit
MRERDLQAGSPLSQTEERFCREYVDCLNATEAYLRAFPKVKRTAAATSGWKLLRKAEIQARVAVLNAHLRQQITERAVVDCEWVIARLVENVQRAMQANPGARSRGQRDRHLHIPGRRRQPGAQPDREGPAECSGTRCR